MTLIEKNWFVFKPLLSLDLQYFSEGGEGDQGGSQAQNDVDYEYQGGMEPETHEQNHVPNPLLTDDEVLQSQQQSAPQSQEPQQAQQAQQAQTQPEEFDFGGRKVRPNDIESIKGVYQDWQNQQQYIQQLQQQTKQFEQMMNLMQQQGVNTQQEQQQGQQPPQTADPERLQQIHDQYMDKMYENVFEAQKWLHSQPEYQEMLRQQVQPIIEPYVQPYEQERQYQQQIQQMQQQYADFDSLIPQMQTILDEKPEIGSRDDALEMVYWMAKGKAATQTPTPEQLLQDRDFQQQILSNEQIRNQVLQQYTQQKQQINSNVPPMMGGSPGGASPAFQQQAPRTLSEASRAFRRSLGLS